MAGKNDLPLAGRVAVITGASRGLGAALARALSAKGARLLLVARNPAALGDVAMLAGFEEDITAAVQNGAEVEVNPHESLLRVI